MGGGFDSLVLSFTGDILGILKFIIILWWRFFVCLSSGQISSMVRKFANSLQLGPWNPPRTWPPPRMWPLPLTPLPHQPLSQLLVVTSVSVIYSFSWVPLYPSSPLFPLSSSFIYKPSNFPLKVLENSLISVPVVYFCGCRSQMDLALERIQFEIIGGVS